MIAMVDPRTLMWARACEMIDRAERLHRQFFQPIVATAYDLRWEPPADITSTGSEIRITVALPGVEPENIKVTVDADRVLVAGLRRPSAMSRGSSIHRLEIPYGKFERQIAFPGMRLTLEQSEYANGCLALTFSK
jgi:HSP20 family protein